MADMDDDDLLEALGVEAAPNKAATHTAKQERLIAGFEDILRFVETHGRAPQHGEDRDIFERLYAVRLDRLRGMPEARDLLAPMDTAGLLDGQVAATVNPDELDEDALLAELGVDAPAGEDDITRLRHVASFAERRAAEEIANRTRCDDFEEFQPLFESVENDLKEGRRKTLRFGRDASVLQGNFFILGGQMAYVAEVGEPIRAPNGEADARMRVIYSNGTESNLLQRSLQRALYKDETGRRITDADNGPLFGDTLERDDIESGTIYVLQSRSDHPFVTQHRELVHKIGVTGGKVETRVAAAKDDATYLLAEVDIVATYKLAHINRTKLENLFHKIFAPAQLDLTLEDRFGKPVKPREWFLVPLQAIDEAVSRIRDGSITDYIYDPKSARLKALK
ncbi:GIY-YIG nuclease family protein [Stenotrophomonas maltophilia]|uniref:GIY-YIG nuclease family protein n=1 Tax=Stenotrophomonas maltophilia TaxID=40324 RepID=UPI0021BF670F|nr:GIY-YIG nuclease family protein [Stenotrophomonas maltophilia]UXL28822.1 GIY-YIG nuclease family protein [Stenotrophomonas maltophilia]